MDLLAVYEEEPEAMQAVQQLRRLLFDFAVAADIMAMGLPQFERTRDTVGALANFVTHGGRIVHGGALAGDRS